MLNRRSTQKPRVIIGLISALGLAAANADQPAANVDQRDPEALEEVTVIGSYLRTSQGDMPSPIEVLEREEFASQGISTPAEFVSTLTINTGAENSADNFTGGGTFGTSNINLRGLGIGANLVLLNGRLPLWIFNTPTLCKNADSPSILARAMYLTRVCPWPFPPWATILKSTMRGREPSTWGLKKSFNSAKPRAASMNPGYPV